MYKMASMMCAMEKSLSWWDVTLFEVLEGKVVGDSRRE